MKFRSILGLVCVVTCIAASLAVNGCGSSSSDDGIAPSLAGDDQAGDGADGNTAADAAQDAVDEVAQAPILITGMLVNAEGLGIPDVTITFHSDPVQTVTDAYGVFSALLTSGLHTFETAGAAAGDIAGDVIVSASDFIDESGHALGTFVADTTSALYDAAACARLRLKDLGDTAITNTAVGIYKGTFGNDEIDAQGINQTAAIVGNSEMTANISIDGRLSGLWFPSVGAYNHIPYLSGVDDWMKPFQGSFAGIKRGDDYYWFGDRDQWDAPEIRYQATATYAPIIEITHTGALGGDCSGAEIMEKFYVVYDASVDNGQRSNVLIRDVQVITPTNASLVCRTTDNAAASPEVVLYARFNPNSRHQLFHQWIASPTITAIGDKRVAWGQSNVPYYTIVMEGMDRYGSRIDIAFATIDSIDMARIVVPDAECFPSAIPGYLAAWPLPTTRRVMVATAGCTVGSAQCVNALDDAESGAALLESTARNRWSSWLTGISSPSNATWADRYKRWLVSLKMLADRNTGAIVASPSQEPTYYYSWPRDGVFQSLAYIMAGKYQEAASFFSFLFDKSQNWDGGWTQAHSSLDGTPLALPDSPLRVSVEEDQPPTVLWGVWVYWKKKGSLPTGIDIADIKQVADYVVGRICPTSGLLWPSLDWHENPRKDIGQSLYTNAAAHAGLLAAAEMVEASDPDAAAKYSAEARTIKNGILDHLCGGGTCHSRIVYDFRWLPDLLIRNTACDHCLNAPFSDADNERIMAFAWPFHLFSMGDSLVQRYYQDTYATHDDLNDFSTEKPLWIPRYLYSYLFAMEANAGGEVPVGEFMNQLDSHIAGYVSEFDDLLTDVGYLMDQYVGGNDPNGSAARPLGWSQAMGILVAFAREGKRVPLIAVPAPTSTDCVPGSGPCCDSTGTFRPSTYQCGTVTEYACPWGTACGDDVGMRTKPRYCSGTDTSCSGSYGTPGTWSVADSCGSSEICAVGDSTCNASASCSTGCTSGVCCDTSTGTLKPSTYQCGTVTEYGCPWGTACGDDVGMRTKPRYCSGSDTSCSGSYGTPGAWSVADSCGSSEVCAVGDSTCNSSTSCSSCTISAWTSNTLTAYDSGGYVTLSWNAAPSWVDHYVVARKAGTQVPSMNDAYLTTIYTIINDFGGSAPQCFTYVVYAVNACGEYRSSTMDVGCF